MYQTILFDLDGTLTNSELGITNSVAYALGKYGIQVPDKESIESFHRSALAGVFWALLWIFLKKNV